MSFDPPRPVRQPKLRSSCDGCGAAKLKCDKARPQCGRCVSNGISCVYGVSRKMGRLPGRIKPNTDSTSIRQASPMDMDNVDCRSDTDGRNGNPEDNMMLDLGSLPDVNHPIAPWSMPDDSSESFMYGIYPEGSPMSSLTLFDFDFNIDAIDGIDRLLSATSQTSHTEDPSKLIFHSSNNAQEQSPIPPSAKKYPCSISDGDFRRCTAAHHCDRDAYKILENLSSIKPGSNQSVSLPQDTNCVDNQVPLDHVLRLNREASECLSRLLSCPCAKIPRLTFLYASIICRILTWYQKATTITQNGLRNSTTAPYHISLEDSSSSLASIPWSGHNTPSSITPKPTTKTYLQSSELTVIPTKMALGAFNIDDHRVQTAVNVQLVLGEMRRTERLIDQLTSRPSSRPHPGEEFPSGGFENLCRGLESWLRGEHSRIVNTLRSYLRKLNT